MPLTPSKPCFSAAHYWVLHFDNSPERLRGYVDRRAHYLKWIHMQDEAQLDGTVLLVGLAVPFQSGCPASSRDTVTHRHYFEKGLQHRLPRGVDIQSAWKSCTLSSFSDNSTIYMELAGFYVFLLQPHLHRQPDHTLQQWSWAWQLTCVQCSSISRWRDFIVMFVPVMCWC